MEQPTEPFFIRGIRVGTVYNLEKMPGFHRGALQLDDCIDRPAFQSVVSLATDVDNAADADYQGCWAMWLRACRKLQELHLCVGDITTQVEAFTIESDWSIEWQNLEIVPDA